MMLVQKKVYICTYSNYLTFPNLKHAIVAMYSTAIVKNVSKNCHLMNLCRMNFHFQHSCQIFGLQSECSVHREDSQCLLKGSTRFPLGL